MQRYIGQFQFCQTNGNFWVDHKLNRRSRDQLSQMIYILSVEKNVIYLVTCNFIVLSFSFNTMLLHILDLTLKKVSQRSRTFNRQ